jgi:hypothetical protein
MPFVPMHTRSDSVPNGCFCAGRGADDNPDYPFCEHRQVIDWLSQGDVVATNNTTLTRRKRRCAASILPKCGLEVKWFSARLTARFV